MIRGNKCYEKNSVIGTTKLAMWFGSFRKFEAEQTYNPAVPLIGIYISETLVHIIGDMCRLYIAALFGSSKKPRESNCSPKRMVI